MQLEARGDATFDNLVQATDTLMYYASQCKELSGLSSSLQADIPQLYFDVDRDKVKLAGVPLADVFSTMKAYTGSVYVNDFNMFNRIYRVYIQAEAPYREHKENINLFFRARDGQCDDSFDIPRNNVVHHRSRQHQALQHVQQYGDSWRSRRGL